MFTVIYGTIDHKMSGNSRHYYITAKAQKCDNTVVPEGKSALFGEKITSLSDRVFCDYVCFGTFFCFVKINNRGAGSSGGERPTALLD